MTLAYKVTRDLGLFEMTDSKNLKIKNENPCSSFIRIRVGFISNIFSFKRPMHLIESC